MLTRALRWSLDLISYGPTVVCSSSASVRGLAAEVTAPGVADLEQRRPRVKLLHPLLPLAGVTESDQGCPRPHGRCEDSPQVDSHYVPAVHALPQLSTWWFQPPRCCTSSPCL